MNGVIAERLARVGIVPESDPMSMVYGAVAITDFDDGAMVDGLGEQWEAALRSFKLHACCRWNHPALDELEVVGKRSSLSA